MISRVIKKTVDLDAVQKVDQLEGPLYQLEESGHTFEITCMSGGTAAAVSGTVSGRFLRADETTVYFTGTLSGNVASITLPQSCYNVNGRFGFVVFVSGSNVTSAIYAVAGNVYRSTSETIIDPTGEIPSLEELMAEIEACEEATASAQQAASFVNSIIAPTYSTGVSYAIGDYCTYEGSMYRCTAATSGAFDPDDWDQVLVGGEFERVDGEVSDLKSAMQPILTCFANVAWTTPDGLEYYNALAAAINPPAELVSISAVYTQTGAVYVTDSLDDLRTNLLVTATYANTTTAVINGYALFGTLTEGTSTITVTYGGKTTTFTVVVSDTALLYKLPQPTTFDGTTSTVIDSGVALVPYDRDFTIVADFTSTNGSTRQHVFYAGDIASPYNSIVLECKKTTYVWGVTSYSSSIEMPNVTTDNPARIVIRHESGSGKYNIICSANGSLVRGETTMDRFISSRNIFVGGMRTTDSALGLIGTIRDFRAFTRYYSDADAMAYVSEVSQ